MASVFLSYDREDADNARPLAMALQKAGHSVWWDLQVRGGAQFSKAIEEALAAADAVVVLWSEHSVESAWVRDEAAVGRDSGRLVPVALDHTEPPLGFRQFQTINLSRWSARRKAPEFASLVGAIESLSHTRKPAPPDPKDAPVPRAKTRFGSLHIGSLLLAVVAIAGLSLFIGSRSHHHVTPTVAVVAADSSPKSTELARDLLAKLGSVQSAQPKSLELVNAEPGKSKADLVLELAAQSAASEPEASLLLYKGDDHSLVWSETFRQPSGNAADLEQQLALTAARVLDCAAEPLYQGGAALSLATLKIYLGACGGLASATSPEIHAQIPALRSVISDTPKFAGAWARLLFAESDLVDMQSGPPSPDTRAQMERDIAAARKLDGDMPEAFLAEYTLLPGQHFLERGALLDRALERNPDSALLLAARAEFRGSVGSTEAAVEDAQRAAQADPISPSARDTLASTLADAGHTDAALEALRQAELLWPGASNLQMAKFRINLRFGDPKVALALLHSGNIETSGTSIHEDFLQARIDPTPENIDRAIKHTQAVVGDSPDAVISYIQTLAQFGREDELVRTLMGWRLMDRVDFITDVLFRPVFRDLHRDGRFMAVAAHLGLLQYWRQSGNWPEFCLDPDTPYECKKEAAKLG